MRRIVSSQKGACMPGILFRKRDHPAASSIVISSSPCRIRCKSKAYVTWIGCNRCGRQPEHMENARWNWLIVQQMKLSCATLDSNSRRLLPYEDDGAGAMLDQVFIYRAQACLGVLALQACCRCYHL